MERTFVFEKIDSGDKLLLVAPNDAIPWRVLDFYIEWHNNCYCLLEDSAQKETASNFRYLYSSYALSFVKELEKCRILKK